MERDIIQIQGKRCSDIVGIIDCQTVQNSFHCFTVQAKNFSGADAIALNIMVKETAQCELVVIVACFCEFIQCVQNYSRLWIFPIRPPKRIQDYFLISRYIGFFVIVAYTQTNVFPERCLYEHDFECIADVSFAQTFCITLHYFFQHRTHHIRSYDIVLSYVLNKPVKFRCIGQIAKH